jgi:hypothetical protein
MDTIVGGPYYVNVNAYVRLPLHLPQLRIAVSNAGARMNKKKR